MIFVEITAVFIPKSVLGKNGEHLITSNFDPNIFQSNPKLAIYLNFSFNMDP